MRLSEKRKRIQKLVFNNKQYKLKITVGRVLRIFEVMADEDLSPTEKIKTSLQLIVKSKIKLLFLNMQMEAALLSDIFKTYIQRGDKKPEKKVFDFSQDAEYIYSAFRQTYNINLLEERDKMSWDEFYSLFISLPDNTKIMQIIDIRQKPIPKATKYNSESRMNLIRLKNKYMVRLTQEEREAELQQGLAKIALTLEAMARKQK